MHIIIATDGALDATAAADVVERLYRDGDTVTAMSAVNFPREFLKGLGEVSGVTEVSRIALESGPGTLGFASGAKTAERMSQRQSVRDEPSGEVVGKYVEATARRRLAGISDALEARGVPTKLAWRQTDNKTAATILEAAVDLKADLLIIGSHGYGRFEGLLGSTSTKLSRRAPIDVMIIRSAPD